MAAAPDNKRPAKRTRGPRFIMLSLFKSFRFSYIGGREEKVNTLPKVFHRLWWGVLSLTLVNIIGRGYCNRYFLPLGWFPNLPLLFFKVTFIYDGIKSRMGKSFLVLICGRIVLVELYLLLIMSAYTRALQSRRSKMNFRPRYSRYPQLICYKLTPARLQK